MSRLIELQVENVMGVKAVTLRPGTSHLYEVVGRNGQGKTSTLDAIEMLLGGGKSIPKRPVRNGQDKARVVAEFDDMVVTRTIRPDGKSTLKIEDKDGRSYASPQALLDSFVSRISFDPFAFSRAKPEELERTLRDLAGLDFAELDAERERVFSERTTVNREVKRLEGELSGVPERVEAPDEEVSVAGLAERLRAAEEAWRKVAADETEAASCASKARSARGRAAELRRQADELEREAEELEQRAESIEMSAGMARADLPDIEGIRSELRTVDATNAAVRANRRRAELEAQLAEARANSEAMTARLAEIDDQKAEALKGASYPLQGLELADDGVLLDGVPFAQANQAARLRAGVAIGCALNPRIKVLLVREGSFLDDEGLELVEKVAAEHDALVLVERVGRRVERVGVVLEDGEVAEVVGGEAT